MNIELIKQETILGNLVKLELIDSNSKPISFSAFKNRALIMKYGKQGRNQMKIVVIGIPNENMFGFYVECNPDHLCIKQAYDWFIQLIKGIENFDEIDIHFGNQGIPLTYKYLRTQ